jgi:hypothetical protein
MPDKAPRSSALSNDWIDSVGRIDATQARRHLAEPLAIVQLALRSPGEAKALFPSYRLIRFVASRLQWDGLDMESFSEIFELNRVNPLIEQRRPFDYQLRHVIARYKLQSLFSDDGPGPYHHAIRPTGYDFRSDAVIPTDMESWRAEYRGMASYCQMLAASIIWLYRGGKDNCWLRRVPCTWHVVDALHDMRSAGAIADWAWLLVLYPGW